MPSLSALDQTQKISKIDSILFIYLEWQTVMTLIRWLLLEQSDLGLHCLPRPVCPKT